MLPFKVFSIIWIIQNVVTGPSYRYFVNYFFPDGVINLIDFCGDIPLIPFVHQPSIFGDMGGKERLKVWNTVDRAALAILEKKELVQKILWPVIQRSS